MTERKPLPPRPDPEPSLEQRIAAALADETVGSNELAILVRECEQTIDEVEFDWEAAFDVRRWPDASEALAHREGCAFRVDRLRGLLVELQHRHRRAVDAERLALWRAEYTALEVKRDALAMELRETYPEVVGRLIDLLVRMGTNDAEISDLHQARPAGVPLHLLGAELIGRGITEFNRDRPSITKELQLPDWVNSARTIWPPPRQSDVPMFALPHNPQFSAEWSSPEVLAAREAAARAGNERISRWHAEQERLQEERINREERERFAQRNR